MLIKARHWINETFDERSKPTMRQVVQWVEDGHITGRKIGKDLYILDSAAFAPAPVVDVQPPANQPKLRRNLLN
ncbi:MAG: hypothetical protein AAF564_26625 [Bacteroidota bacterium]